MGVDATRTVADLEELRELTGNAEGAQRVAWTDTWEEARNFLREKLEADRRGRGDRRGGESVVHAAGCVRPGASDRRSYGLGAERRLARRLPERPGRRRGAAAPRRASGSRRVTVRLVSGRTRKARASAARCSARRQPQARCATRTSCAPVATATGWRCRMRSPRTASISTARSGRARSSERRRVPRAAHRAGTGARVDGHPARRRPRHVRRRAVALHVARPGGARRLDADGQAARRTRGRGEARALHPRDRRRGGRRRRVHLGRRRHEAGDRHVGRRDGGTAARPAPSRRGVARADARDGEGRGRTGSPPRRTSRSSGSGSGASSRSSSTRR